MKLRLDRFKTGIPKMKPSPGVSKVLIFLKKVLSMVAITLSVLCILLAISELFVFWIDSSAGVDNYVDWTRSLIAPIVLSAVFGSIAILLNLDRIFKRKVKADPGANGGKLEILDLD
jgi:hypothetical protein